MRLIYSRKISKTSKQKCPPAPYTNVDKVQKQITLTLIIKAMKTFRIYTLFILAFGILATPKIYAHQDPCPTGNGKATLIDIRVDGKKVDDFFAVKPGSEVSVSFTIAGTQPTEFSLVSYRLPEPGNAMTPEESLQMDVYQQASRKGNPGSRITLKVHVPDCYYRLYFLKGCVVQQYDATCDNTYEKWNRVVEVVEGGDHSCKPQEPKKITICHIPPGNPDNAHTITVSENSWPAHQKHGDYMGECKADSTPTGDTTAECACDYDGDGLPDRVYGATYTSVDGAYAVHYSAGSDTAVVMAQEGTIDMITVYYEDGTTQDFTNVNASTKTIVSSGSDIVAVEVNGNFVENSAKLDPDQTCDCFTDQPGEPVPVKLTYFKGEKLTPNVVKLSWQTASEENNDYFQVVSTTDMKDWKEVCHVPGSGTTKEVKDYSCTDNNAGESGQNLVYYKLKQVDLNGTYEYSDVIRIRLQAAAYATSVDKVYPNPTKDRLFIEYNAPENGLFTLRLMTMEGKVLLNSSFVATTGTQTADLDLPESLLKPGMYVLEVQNENEVFRQKVYKQ
jgi:hypothetical protein